MIFTLFLSPLQQVWPDDVTDPAQSKLAYRFRGEDKYNILYQKIEQFELDDGSTRTISYANYASTQWAFIIARVVGEVTINTSGFDTNGSTPITGKLPIYGKEILPGIGILSTYNVSTFTVESHEDGSTVELYAAIAAADDDPLID